MTRTTVVVGLEIYVQETTLAITSISTYFLTIQTEAIYQNLPPYNDSTKDRKNSSSICDTALFPKLGWMVAAAVDRKI